MNGYRQWLKYEYNWPMETVALEGIKVPFELRK